MNINILNQYVEVLDSFAIELSLQNLSPIL